MSNVVTRTAGRLLIIDPAGRVLMINGAIDPSHPYWLIPGGGVEGGESPQEAAVREAYEETGLRLDSSSRRVWVEQRIWSYGGVTYDQTNHFFVARAPAGVELSERHFTELERNTFLGYRWWHPDEIEASDEVFYPEVIAELTRGALASA